jgi:hypothetical protein
MLSTTRNLMPCGVRKLERLLFLSFLIIESTETYFILCLTWNFVVGHHQAIIFAQSRRDIHKGMVHNSCVVYVGVIFRPPFLKKKFKKKE